MDVFGHSYGAHCALEAALLTTGMRRLVLYEPAIMPVTPPGFTDRLVELLAHGRREAVVTAIFELAGMTPEQQELAMSAPSWPNRVAAAHTVVRECRAEEEYRFDPTRFAALSVRTLLLAGTDTPPDLATSTTALTAALPGARLVTMVDQGHVAMLTAPKLFTAEVLAFVRSR